MSRCDFTSKTKRQAWTRSGERCEGAGDIYGLPTGQRCGADLNLGVEYDHIDPDANSKDNSLENCCACCVPCHKFKTSNRDRPLIAKTNHQQDNARGIFRRKSRPMPGSKASGWKRRMDGTAERRS